MVVDARSPESEFSGVTNIKKNRDYLPYGFIDCSLERNLGVYDLEGASFQAFSTRRISD